MTFCDDVRFREKPDIVDRVEAIAEETERDTSEVYRRLLRLGLDDVDMMSAETAMSLPDIDGDAAAE